MSFTKVFLLLLFPLPVLSQDLQLKQRIDSIVKAIDNHPAETFMFSDTAIFEQIFKGLAENPAYYSLKEINGSTFKINVDFRDDMIKRTQLFYTFEDELIYSIESEVGYDGKDSINRSATYYFSRSKLHEYRTTGHTKTAPRKRNPEEELKANYLKAFMDSRVFKLNKGR